MMLWLVFSMICSLGGAALPGYRLPGDIYPVHYDLSIITDMEEFTFNGNVIIQVHCTKPTNKIILHSNQLLIADSNVTVHEVIKDKKTKLGVISNQDMPEHDFHIIILNQNVIPNKTYLISIPFFGNLSQGLEGYYQSNYIDRSLNQTKWLGVTHFEATYARKAFPCFDEPEMKARFSIRLGHKKHLKSISNMPLIETKPLNDEGDWVWDVFQESVPMSTYLVAWIVSEFDYKTAPRLANNVTFRIWARKEAIEQVDFASHVGPKVLAFYDKLFDIKYPLPKQDMAAIPDFGVGAMENWGLITFQETYLLFDNKQSSIQSQERIAYVIAHELAHQWFGNLVTMNWWTDLWLNEGFATYVGCLGVNHVFPEWDYPTISSLRHIDTVLQLDSLKSSHQVSIMIGNPSQIDEIFDDISYEKGSTIIRMMHKFLGKSFSLGVSNYLKEHEYGNAEQDNLWDALTAQAHKDKVLDERLSVKKIMDSWTLQTGYPLLRVIRDYDKGTATITQVSAALFLDALDVLPLGLTTNLNCKSFGTQNFINFIHKFKYFVPLGKVNLHLALKLISIDKETNSIYSKNQERYLSIPEEKVPNDTCWWVPLTYTTQQEKNFNDTSPKQWLDCEDQKSIVIEGLPKGSEEWVIFNIEYAALGRVQYDDTNWDLIIKTLNSDSYKTIGSLNRAALFMDIFDFAKRGDVPYSFAFKLASYLTRETEYIPYSRGFSSLLRIATYLERTPGYGQFKNYMKQLIAPLFVRYNVLTNIPTSQEEVKLFKLATSWACKYEVGNCLDQAKELFNKWTLSRNFAEKNPIPTDVRELVYCSAVRLGGHSVWDTLWEKYRTSNYGSEKSTILEALACSRDVWILNRYLDWSIDPNSDVRRQDSSDIFMFVMAHDSGFYVAKDFLYRRIKDIHKHHESRQYVLGDYLTSYAAQIVNDYEYNAFKQFIEHNNECFKGAKLSVEQSLENAASQRLWHTNNYDTIIKMLSF